MTKCKSSSMVSLILGFVTIICGAFLGYAFFTVAPQATGVIYVLIMALGYTVSIGLGLAGILTIISSFMDN